METRTTEEKNLIPVNQMHGDILHDDKKLFQSLKHY